MPKPEENLPLPIPTSYGEYEVWLSFAKTDKFGVPAIVQALENVKAPFIKQDPLNAQLISALLENELPENYGRNELLEIFNLLDKKLYVYRPEGDAFAGATTLFRSAIFGAKWEWVGSMVEHTPDVAIPVLLKHFLLKHSSITKDWSQHSSTTPQRRKIVWDHLCHEARKIQQGRTSKNYEWHEIGKVQIIQRMLSAHPDLVEETTKTDQAILLRLFTRMPGFRSVEVKNSETATCILLSKKNRDNLTATAKSSQRGAVKLSRAGRKTKPVPKM